MAKAKKHNVHSHVPCELELAQCTLGILIKALPPIRALPRKNVNIFIRALPLIRALPGKSQSLTVKIFHRQFKQKKKGQSKTITVTNTSNASVKISTKL